MAAMTMTRTGPSRPVGRVDRTLAVREVAILGWCGDMCAAFQGVATDRTRSSAAACRRELSPRRTGFGRRNWPAPRDHRVIERIDEFASCNKIVGRNPVDIAPQEGQHRARIVVDFCDS